MGSTQTWDVGPGRSLTVTGGVSGSFGLSMTDSGKLTLSGSNTYTGGTTISSGTVSISADNNLGGASGGLTFGAGGMLLNTASFTTSRGVSLNFGGGVFAQSSGSVGLTVSGPISGNGSLTKVGAGTLTVGGPNSYSGKTFLTSGTMVINTANMAGLYEALVSNGNGADTTDAIPLTSIQSVARWGGPGPFTTQGNNVYPNWGDNTTWGYSGYLLNKSSSAVTYNFGKNFDDSAFLVIDGVSVINNTTWSTNATGSITLGPGLHTVDLRFGQGSGGVGPNTGAYNNYGISYNTVGNTATTGTWLQMGASDPNTQFFAAVTGAPSSSVVMSSNTTLDLSAAGPGMVALGSLADTAGSPTGHQVLLGSNTLDVGLDNSSTTFSGVISGSGGSLIKTGSGTFTLAGANVFSGTTTVSGGELLATTTAALPGYNTPGRVSVAGGSVLAVRTGDGTNGWSGGQIDSLRASANWASALSGSNSPLLGIDTTNGDFTYRSNITQPLGLVKLGANTLYLTGSNGITGTTTLSGGVLSLLNSAALAGSGSIVFGGGTLQFSTFNTGDYSANIVNSTGPISIDTNGQSVTFASAVTSSNIGGLTKTGAGTLILAGSNTYSGPTLVSGGTLQIGNAAGSGSVAGNIILSNATLNFARSSNTYDFAASISGTGTLVKGIGYGSSGSADLVLDGTVSGAISINVNAGRLFFDSQVNLGTGLITIASGAVVDYGGGSPLTLANNISLASGGCISTRNFPLTLGDNLILPSSGTVVFNADDLSTTTLTVSGTSALQLNGTLIVQTGAAHPTGDVYFSRTIAGAGGLIKTQVGTLILTNSNTYNGPTAINAGKLVVNGSLASPVTVNSGGTLGGTGSLANVTVNAGGHLAPGDSLGVLDLSGNLTLAFGAEMDYELDGLSTDDEVMMPTGHLILSGQQFSNFNFTALAGFGPGNYTLIDAELISGSLGTSTTGMINGYPATLAVQGNNDLVLNVTPEPSTLVLLAVGAIGLVGYGSWRRR